MQQWQERTAMLVGEEMLEHFRNSVVAVIGVGGVGGYAAEMVVRAGVGHLIIMDSDDVSVTNKNRQLLALDSTVGKPKCEVLAEPHGVTPFDHTNINLLSRIVDGHLLLRMLHSPFKPRIYYNAHHILTPQRRAFGPSTTSHSAEQQCIAVPNLPTSAGIDYRNSITTHTTLLTPSSLPPPSTSG